MTGSRNYRPPSGTHNYIFDPGQINIALENSNRVLVPVFTGPTHLSISGLSHRFFFSSRLREEEGRKEAGWKFAWQLFFEQKSPLQKQNKNHFIKNYLLWINVLSISLFANPAKLKILQNIRNCKNMAEDNESFQRKLCNRI